MLSKKITTKYGEEITDLLLHMIDYTPEGLVTINENHQIMVFNQGAERIFGYSPEEMMDKDVSLLVPGHAKDLFSRQLDQFVKTHSAVCDQSDIPATATVTLSGLRKSNDEFPCEATISKIRFRDHVYLIFALEDITLRLQQEQQKREEKINKRAELILQVTEQL